jgi:hypothetical protein
VTRVRTGLLVLEDFCLELLPITFTVLDGARFKDGDVGARFKDGIETSEVLVGLMVGRGVLLDFSLLSNPSRGCFSLIRSSLSLTWGMFLLAPGSGRSGIFTYFIGGLGFLGLGTKGLVFMVLRTRLLPRKLQLSSSELKTPPVEDL